jgi:hypothetical protein
MSDPDRLTSRDDTASFLETRGLILRIIVVSPGGAFGQPPDAWPPPSEIGRDGGYAGAASS